MENYIKINGVKIPLNEEDVEKIKSSYVSKPVSIIGLVFPFVTLGSFLSYVEKDQID